MSGAMSLRSEHEPALAQALDDFELFPSMGTAADLLRFGPRIGRSDDRLKVAAAYLLEQDGLPEALRKLAQDVMGGTRTSLWVLPTADCAEGIRQARHSLSNYPRDALTWLDLGRLHATKGNLNSAQRAVIIALAHGGQNRFILRGASRFFLHAGDPERALATLNHSPRTPRDPWLMAGHIAISSILDRSSQYAAKGRRIVQKHDLPRSETAELAMALGTLELENGATRLAKKMFNIGLESPNENALAQGAWAARELNTALDLPSKWLDASCSVEAAYYQALAEADFERALRHSIHWHRMEPFASRPMVAASFLAGILGQVNDAVAFARQGLVADPENMILQNNYVFSLALAGSIPEAEQALAKVARHEKDGLSAQTIANLGMLAFLSGESELGERLYDSAIGRYQRDKYPQHAAVAGACRALAAELAGSERRDFWKQDAYRLARAAGSPLAERICEALLDKQSHRPAFSESYRAIPRRWHYDKQSNVLVVEARKPFRGRRC